MDKAKRLLVQQWLKKAQRDLLRRQLKTGQVFLSSLDVVMVGRVIY